MRLRLVVYNDPDYLGFPITVNKVNYFNDEYAQLEVEVITDEQYGKDFILKQKKFYLSKDIRKLGNCELNKLIKYD